MNQTSTAIVSSTASSVAKAPWASVARNIRVAVICASWHTDVVHQARNALVGELTTQGVPEARIAHFDVPGAFEIPLMAKRLALTGQFDAIIGCALVVNGGIYRHEFVSSAVIDGLMRVQLDTDVPVLSAVLTPRDFHEHADHLEFFRAHFVKKGVEVAQSCLSAVYQLQRVNSLG